MTNLPRQVKDHAGERFGRLTVVSFAGCNHRNQAMWLCSCDCGGVKVATGSALRCGETRSCGCVQREYAKAKAVALNSTHGMAGTPTYAAWQSMLARCKYPSSIGYKNYGGRGITVCERWMEFENFLQDMGERPDGRSLDRINVNGNYEPGNCRWATTTEQARNRRDTRLIEINGRVATLIEWTTLSAAPSAFWHRLKRGWPPEVAFSAPSGTRLASIKHCASSPTFLTK